MQAIQQLDIKKMATANVSVLRELQSYTPQLERFGQYLQNVNDFIGHVNTLNESINSQMNRTQLIERMGTFFEQEVKDIEQRKAAISQAVGIVDDRLQQTLHALQDNAEKSMQSMNEALVRKQDIFNKALDEQQEIFKRKIQENSNIFDELKRLETVASAIKEQGKKLDAELASLNELKNEISMMGTSQNKKMDELIAAVERLSLETSTAAPAAALPIKQTLLDTLPKPIKYMLFVFVSLGIVVFLLFLILLILLVR